MRNVIDIISEELTSPSFAEPAPTRSRVTTKRSGLSVSLLILHIALVAIVVLQVVIGTPIYG